MQEGSDQDDAGLPSMYEEDGVLLAAADAFAELRLVKPSAIQQANGSHDTTPAKQAMLASAVTAVVESAAAGSDSAKQPPIPARDTAAARSEPAKSRPAPEVGKGTYPRRGSLRFYMQQTASPSTDAGHSSASQAARQRSELKSAQKAGQNGSAAGIADLDRTASDLARTGHQSRAEQSLSAVARAQHIVSAPETSPAAPGYTLAGKERGTGPGAQQADAIEQSQLTPWPAHAKAAPDSLLQSRHAASASKSTPQSGPHAAGRSLRTNLAGESAHVKIAAEGPAELLSTERSWTPGLGPPKFAVSPSPGAALSSLQLSHMLRERRAALQAAANQAAVG